MSENQIANSSKSNSRNTGQKFHSTHVDVRMVALLDPDSDLFMRVAQHAYKDHANSLVPCRKCGRKFFPDRIERHQETCAAEPVKISKQMSQKGEQKKVPQTMVSTGRLGHQSTSNQNQYTNNQQQLKLLPSQDHQSQNSSTTAAQRRRDKHPN